MADVDYKSSLPVRSEADGADARVQVKVVDATNPATQQMEVDTDNNAHVEMHGNDPAGVDRVARLAENGAVQSDGVYDAATNTKPSNQGVVLQTRNATAADSRQVERQTAKRGTTDTTVVSADVSMHDENGNAYTTANPLPVVISNEEVGTPVHEHLDDTGVNPTGLAAGASVTLTYTVPAGSPLTLKKVSFAASGRIKAEIKTGTSGSATKRYTMFNSTASPNQEKDFPKNSIVAVADVVEITFTNMDHQPFTVYMSVDGTIGA